MACSHIDLQLKTVLLLNEGVLNSLAPGSREFTGLNKSKAILAAAGRSVGAPEPYVDACTGCSFAVAKR